MLEYGGKAVDPPNPSFQYSIVPLSCHWPKEEPDEPELANAFSALRIPARRAWIDAADPLEIRIRADPQPPASNRTSFLRKNVTPEKCPLGPATGAGIQYIAQRRGDAGLTKPLPSSVNRPLTRASGLVLPAPSTYDRRPATSFRL